ncbi:MAG: D-ribose pyranase [Ilumatobacteraceae bacterium]
MRRNGVVHPDLARILATLGHGDIVCVADVGLPIPQGVERVDLAYRLGAPPFADVLIAIADELVTERVTIAGETARRSPEVVSIVTSTFPQLDIETVDHEELKRLTRAARVVVRTGETTPYANVLLTSGVPF